MDSIRNISELTIDSFQKEEKKWLEILSEAKNWRDIPMLNHISTQNLTDSCLVRFRGMVQDMKDPEIYLEQYEVVTKSNRRTQDGKYRDFIVKSDTETLYQISPLIKSERRTLIVVSIPGYNDWSVNYEKKCCTHQRANAIQANSSLTECKREMEMDETTATASANNKRLKLRTVNDSSDATSVGQSFLSSEFLLNSPILERPSNACMIKIYSDFDEYLLNTVIDVVGFLSVDPALDGSLLVADEFENICQLQSLNPPPSLIPRLHAVHVRKLEHINPLLDSSLGVIDELSNSFDSIEKDLHVILTQCLLGDAIAASYLLCHLLSTVYVRTEFKTLGQFSLNICSIPNWINSSYTKEFYEVIASLLPASHYIPMTLHNLNTMQFTPKKDYRVDRLTSGVLQLAPHTHLVLDETKLEAGKLEATGVLAVQSLANLIKSQQIKCNFEFFDLDINANIPVLILSEGKSLLPTDALIPLSVDPESVPLIEETLTAAKHYLEPKLHSIRKYLTLMRLQTFEINLNVSKMIQNDFVAIRQENSEIGAEYLHALLVFSRLLALSKGKNQLDADTWKAAKAMEEERRKRVQNLIRK